jgi:hypothetical protein
MVPIHDTDVAEERWSQSEWENFELWEKVELRLKRQRRFWILGTLFLFLVFSSVPIVMDRWPKWMTRSAAGRLAKEVNRIKREASVDRVAYRIRLLENGKLNYVVERLQSCSSQLAQVVRSSSLIDSEKPESYTWIFQAKGNELGIPGLVDEFCYDAYQGSGSARNDNDLVGFGIIPIKDVPDKRVDRVSVLLLMGPSAEISFD